MLNPALTILFTILGILFIFFMFMPQNGFVSLINRFNQNRQRRFIEDALKHIYHCESQQLTCTIQSLAGALTINTDRTTKLISRLEKLSLIKSGNRGIQLTKHGRSYALAIIRTHRLWELYLATETGINEKPVVSINGPVKVTEDELTEFTFTITDAEEDNVSLYVDWGDETNTGWSGPYSDYPIVINLEHAWPEGKYTISADVKDPYQNGEGDSLQISSPFIRSFDSYIFNLLQRIIQRFPVLKLILSSFPTFYKILEI